MPELAEDNEADNLISPSSDGGDPRALHRPTPSTPGDPGAEAITDDVPVAIIVNGRDGKHFQHSEL